MPKFNKHLTGSDTATEFISQLEGDKYITQPLYYSDGTRKYTHIAGVLVFPDFERRGYLLTVGIERGTDKIYCVDEFSSDQEYEIISKAKEIQKEYGPEVIQDWYGDPEALLTIVTEDEEGLILSPFIDSDREDAFQVYVSRIWYATSETNQTFFFDQCDIARNSFIAFSKAKSRVDDNPVLFAIGGLLHSLLVIRPWEQAFEQIELRPTTVEDMLDYENEQHAKEFMHELYADL